MGELVEILKLPPVILAAISLASGVILFLPEELVGRLYMTEFKSQYGFVIGITFLVSLSILICYLVVAVMRKIGDEIHSKKVVKKQEEIVQTLDMYEKEILRGFMRQGDRTLELPMNNGIVRTLQHKMLIAPAGSNHIVDMSFEIPFLIQPWAHTKFLQHPELLQ